MSSVSITASSQNRVIFLHGHSDISGANLIATVSTSQFSSYNYFLHDISADNASQLIHVSLSARHRLDKWIISLGKLISDITHVNVYVCQLYLFLKQVIITKYVKVPRAKWS